MPATKVAKARRPTARIGGLGLFVVEVGLAGLLALLVPWLLP